jgi:hypothetical protein
VTVVDLALPIIRARELPGMGEPPRPRVLTGLDGRPENVEPHIAADLAGCVRFGHNAGRTPLLEV